MGTIARWYEFCRVLLIYDCYSTMCQLFTCVDMFNGISQVSVMLNNDSSTYEVMFAFSDHCQLQTLAHLTGRYAIQNRVCSAQNSRQRSSHLSLRVGIKLDRLCSRMCGDHRSYEQL